MGANTRAYPGTDGAADTCAYPGADAAADARAVAHADAHAVVRADAHAVASTVDVGTDDHILADARPDEYTSADDDACAVDAAVVRTVARSVPAPVDLGAAVTRAVGRAVAAPDDHDASHARPVRRPRRRPCQRARSRRRSRRVGKDEECEGTNVSYVAGANAAAQTRWEPRCEDALACIAYEPTYPGAPPSISQCVDCSVPQFYYDCPYWPNPLRRAAKEMCGRECDDLQAPSVLPSPVPTSVPTPAPTTTLAPTIVCANSPKGYCGLDEVSRLGSSTHIRMNDRSESPWSSSIHVRMNDTSESLRSSNIHIRMNDRSESPRVPVHKFA